MEKRTRGKKITPVLIMHQPVEINASISGVQFYRDVSTQNCSRGVNIYAGLDKYFASLYLSDIKRPRCSESRDFSRIKSVSNVQEFIYPLV